MENRKNEQSLEVSEGADAVVEKMATELALVLLVVGHTDDTDDPARSQSNAPRALSTHRSLPSLKRPCSVA